MRKLWRWWRNGPSCRRCATAVPIPATPASSCTSLRDRGSATMSKRSDCSSQLGGASLLSCVAVLLVTALPLTAAAQSCVPTRDPVLIAATQAQRAGHIDEARKIVWDGRQAIEQSAPDSPKLA